MVDPTQAHDYAGYVGEFEVYDQMEEEAMFYQPQEEAEDEEEAKDEEVPDDIVPEPEAEPRRRRRALLIPPFLVVGPPFPRSPKTTHLLSDYARHVEIPLWVNHHNMWYDGEYKCINSGRKVRELSLPEKGLNWFWDPVEASGLHYLIYTGYSTVTHAMVRALCEKWHTE